MFVICTAVLQTCPIYMLCARGYLHGMNHRYICITCYNVVFVAQANTPYDVKENAENWRSLQQSAAAGACFPYEASMAMYPYGPG